ncbi:hypothetical protein [Chitinophaga tropicalis]|uniref:VCBS repeat-containing protein n=1 Tax=Chitinophaga tropicalis TaxID=2683588 RepID=A0A7K1U6M6_9BACT|nr:hypothetical protein [Chitinophaga tropicalis]MVT09625.1 hypothetical protein [Chitinophaga tropicalis]
MKRSLYTSLVILLLTSCSNSGREQQADSSKVTSSVIDTDVMEVVNPPEKAEVIPDTVRVEGDFNGDSIPDIAYGVLFKGHRDGDDAQDQYIVRFSNKKIPAMPVQTGKMRLINEGDLNNDGRDDITIFGEPLHGCTYNVSTYYNDGTRWRELADTWLLPYYCDFISDEELQNRIVFEDGVVYFYEADVNDENATLIKKELPLK